MSDKGILNMLDLSEIRKKFHQRPETYWTEFWTTVEICKYLEEFGYDLMVGKELYKNDLRKLVPEEEIIDKWYQNAVSLGSDPKYLEKLKGGFTGVIGILDTGKEGPVIAFRADIDALPMQESKSDTHRPAKEGWASMYEGIMHSCGHDVHLTIGLGIAEWIANNKDSLSGKFIMIFSPAEEFGQSCLSISELPLIDEIQYLLTYHDSSANLGGNHVINPKIFFRAMNSIRVSYSNKPDSRINVGELVEKYKNPIDITNEFIKAISSLADLNNNPIMAACTAIINLQAIPQLPYGFSKILITGINTPFHEIGYAMWEPVSFNVIIRSSNDNIGKYMITEARKLVESTAKMFDVKVKIDDEWDSAGSLDWPAWEGNSPELVELAIKSWKEIGMGENYVRHPFGELGSDDVIFLMNKVKKNGGKAIYIGLVSDNDSGKIGNIHSSNFDFKDDLLYGGVNLIIKMIEKLIERA